MWVCSVTQSCPTLSSPLDCSLPGSSDHGILQARILEWVSISSSGGSSGPWDWGHVSWISCTAGRFFPLAPSLPHKVKWADMYRKLTEQCLALPKCSVKLGCKLSKRFYCYFPGCCFSPGWPWKLHGFGDHVLLDLLFFRSPEWTQARSRGSIYAHLFTCSETKTQRVSD